MVKVEFYSYLSGWRGRLTAARRFKNNFANRMLARGDP